MGRPRIPLTPGERFGRLVVVEGEPERLRNGIVWPLKCDCGREHRATAYVLRDGRVKSCGCLNDEMRVARNTTHGFGPCKANRKGHPLYQAWQGMVRRCHDPKHADYPNYGGRGIAVCERWREDFSAFLADVGERPTDRPSLDRIDNSKGYELGNVQWATWSEQRTNQRRMQRTG